MIRRLLAPALVGALAAALYFLVNRYGLNVGLVQVDEFYGEQFYAVIATLYAIITALLLVQGIESFSALSAAVNDEAMKVRSINAYLTYFYSSGQDIGLADIAAIRQKLLDYMRRIRERHSAEAQPENEAVIDQCIHHCAKIQVADENDRIALTEVMRGLDALHALRVRRVHCAREKIPAYLIGMLALMTAAIMAPFYLHHEAELGFNYYILFTLGTFGSFIYFLLNDINRPFSGMWQVDFSPYEEAEKELQREHGSLRD